MRLEQKAAERADLETFLRCKPELVQGKIIECERPDFVIHSGERRIGIEVTQFELPHEDGEPRPEEQDSLRRHTVRVAWEQYRDKGGPPLHVQITFDKHIRLTKRRVPELATGIAGYLSRINVKVWHEYRKPPQLPKLGKIRSYNFLPEVERISAVRSSEDRETWFADRGGGWPYRAQLDDLTPILQKKEPRIPSYRKECDEIWLLIVFEPLKQKNDIQVKVPRQPVEFTIATDFDRLFCLDPYKLRYVEIPLERSSTP